MKHEKKDEGGRMKAEDGKGQAVEIFGEGGVAIAECCSIAEREEQRLVLTPDGVWHLFRWGVNPDEPASTIILDTWPVHFCPLCGRALDAVGLGDLMRRLNNAGIATKDASPERLQKLLAPTRPYLWGHMHINVRLADLRFKGPDPAKPFRVTATAAKSDE